MVKSNKFAVRCNCILLTSFYIFIIGCSGRLYAAIPLEPENVHYLEITGNNELPFRWKKTVQPAGTVEILLVEGQKKFVNICTVSGATLRWEFTDGKKDQVKAWRRGDYNHVTGTKNGATVKLKKKIDSRPWYQPLSYSLRSFLGSDEEKISFWTIRSNTLDIYAMEPMKKRKEEISTIGGTELTQVVEIRVEGFLSKFWHCTYWYRQEDGLFLKFQATHGPIGTEKTTVHVAAAN